VGIQVKIDGIESHAELAMKAARGVAQARRRRQKEKMGHVVCQHLLQMLNAESELPVRRHVDIERVTAKPFEDKQISLAF